MIQLTNENFKTEVLAADGLVLVDFYSATCGPCKAMEPVLKAAAAKHPRVKFCKAEPEAAGHCFEQYGVMYVPTFLLFRRGEVVGRQGGLVAGKVFDDWVAGHE